MPCINFATWAELAAYVMIVRVQGNKIGFCASVSRDTGVEETSGARCGAAVAPLLLRGTLSSLPWTFVPERYSPLNL